MSDEDIIQSVFNTATSDRFIFIFDIPPILKNRASKFKSITNPNVYKMATTIKGTIFPKVVVPATKIPYAGSQMMVSSHVRDPYGTQTFSFNVLNNWDNYLAIQYWLNLLHNEVGGSYNSDKKTFPQFQDDDSRAIQYFSTFVIYVVDEFGKPVIKGKFTNAFPVGLSEVSLNYNEAKEIIVDVEFGFSQFQITGNDDINE